MSKANALLNGEWGKQKKAGKKHTSKKRRAEAKKYVIVYNKFVDGLILIRE